MVGNALPKNLGWRIDEKALPTRQFYFTKIVLTFLGLGLIVFPYIIPSQIKIYQAAADPSSLVIMIIFIGFLIPIMLFYNLYQYIVFRGKVTETEPGE